MENEPNLAHLSPYEVRAYNVSNREKISLTKTANYWSVILQAGRCNIHDILLVKING